MTTNPSTAKGVVIASCQDLLGLDRKGFGGVPAIFGEAHGIGRWLFRGQANIEHRLVPALYRRTPKSGIVWEHHEESLLRLFKLNALPFLAQPPSGEEEWIVLARHYGVPTRLLDWSKKPLVALWFAVSENPTTDGSLYMIRSMRGASGAPEDGIEDLPEFGSDTHSFGSIVPHAVSPRVAAQGSVLTTHRPPPIRADFTPLDDLDLGDNLRRAVIPANRKAALLEELRSLGIDRFSIYPSLEGLASWVAELHAEVANGA